MEEMVDFMAARMLAPSSAEVEMAQRLARRYARIHNEFGYFTAGQLADANGSQASNRTALADDWRKRRQAFAVPHPDKAARERDIYPAFQFDDGKPIKAVQKVLEAFDGRKTPWKLALWFVSNNGRLPDSARPVDLLSRDPNAVVQAARRDAEESAARAAVRRSCPSIRYSTAGPQGWGSTSSTIPPPPPRASIPAWTQQDGCASRRVLPRSAMPRAGWFPMGPGAVPPVPRRRWPAVDVAPTGPRPRADAVRGSAGRCAERSARRWSVGAQRCTTGCRSGGGTTRRYRSRLSRPETPDIRMWRKAHTDLHS